MNEAMNETALVTTITTALYRIRQRQPFIEPPKYNEGDWEFSCCGKKLAWHDSEKEPLTSDRTCDQCFCVYGYIFRVAWDMPRELIRLSSGVPANCKFGAIGVLLSKGLSPFPTRAEVGSYIAGEWKISERISLEDLKALAAVNENREYQTSLQWSLSGERSRIEELNRFVSAQTTLIFNDDHLAVLEKHGKLAEFLNLMTLRHVQEVQALKAAVREIAQRMQGAGMILSGLGF